MGIHDPERMAVITSVRKYLTKVRPELNPTDELNIGSSTPPKADTNRAIGGKSLIVQGVGKASYYDLPIIGRMRKVTELSVEELDDLGKQLVKYLHTQIMSDRYKYRITSTQNSIDITYKRQMTQEDLDMFDDEQYKRDRAQTLKKARVKNA